MKSYRHSLGFLAAALVLAFSTQSAKATWVNGWWIYPYTHFQSTTYSSRPFSIVDAQAGLAVQDYSITNLPVDAKGMNITGTEWPDGSYLSYRWLRIQHCEIQGPNRLPGSGTHVDFLRIKGVGSRQKWPMTIKLIDLYIHDGDGLSVFLESAKVDQLLLKDIRIVNASKGQQLTTMTDGSIGSIIIDHCPDQSIGVMGRPGTVGVVYIRNSPGLRIGDVLTAYGKTNCRFVWMN